MSKADYTKRVTLVARPETHARIKRIAKLFGVTQFEAMEILIDACPDKEIAPWLKRNVEEVKSAREMATKMKAGVNKELASLTPEQLQKAIEYAKRSAAEADAS